MKIAETVTFAGKGMDRAAHLRADPDRIAALLSDPAARALPLWRGKPPVVPGDRPRVRTVATDHPILGEAREAPIFLGFAATDGAALFAYDISGWEPEGPRPEQGVFFDSSEQAHPSLPEAGFVELRGVMARIDPDEAAMAATARAILNWHRSHGFCAVCGAKSEIVMSGWQRSCPACGGQHFPRTDPVVIMLITQGNSVLLGRSPGWPEGMYSLLAGFVEPGETIEAAVRREVAEETAVPVGRVGYLASQPWPYPSSLMIGCWGEAQGREITLDPHELEDALWLTREEVVDSFAGRHPRVKPAREGAIAHFLLKNWLADRLD